ncbi:TPA: type III secretion system ATPase SctN [Citrobacter pasteurii]|uniref:type III secretion system ATPase SctN n=1 Tax=Citrobacter sp. Cu233 TaxID=2985160 RepID=UPI0025757186|nr:type III secretion system ATPase SctN [Citrobacter sp. Cu233]MDM2932065.1 type III secretion system ATPase SctN [Citrobacter sp. Cu233]
MQEISLRDIFRCDARITSIHGSIITAPLRHTFVGERCRIYRSLNDRHFIGQAETIGFNKDNAVLCLLGGSDGISCSDIVVPDGSVFSLSLSLNTLGTVINAQGEICERFAQQAVNDVIAVQRPIMQSPPDYSDRRPINTLFATGVRAIDGLLTCGIGQRVGIFAGAGAGKTSLMTMIISHSIADVYVVGLVGERGREVTEFLAEGIPEDKRDKTVVVYSTSDRPAVERRNAALIATTVAEYFRDAGKNVVLMIDSMTRYARALRDVALSAGEMPARRGYPSSVFDNLPRILERSGKTRHGSITAFYTVLLEEEEEVDPIGDEVRSILDGHIYLSRKLAGTGHYPAIDVLRSVSRVTRAVSSDEQREAASLFRGYLSKLDELKLMIELGEYQPGENPTTDSIVGKKEALMAFLQQKMVDKTSFEQMLEYLYAI